MKKALLFVVLALAGALGYLALLWMAPGGGDRYAGDFALVDHHGNAITRSALDGHPTLVFFGFTHCPEICPTTLFEMSRWFEELGADGAPLKAYFFTVDPERDTPELLGPYVTATTDRVIGITGDPEQVWANAKSFNIFWRKVPLEGGDYTMDHTASVILLKPDGSFFGTIAYGEALDSAVAKLRRLLASS